MRERFVSSVEDVTIHAVVLLTFTEAPNVVADFHVSLTFFQLISKF